jgi:hypothetical protein
MSIASMSQKIVDKQVGEKIAHPGEKWGRHA